MDTYEKKYKEALERAKEYLKEYYFEEAVKEIFPELKESEDERIRDEIILYIGAKDDISLDTHNKWLAWLEKQGEQKPDDNVEPKFKVGDIVQYITDSTDRRKIEEVDELCNMYHTDSSPIMFEVEDEWKLSVLAEDVENELHVNFPQFTFDDVLALQCTMENVKKVQEDKDLYEKLNDLHDRLHDAYWLEKQGEQKPTQEIEPFEAEHGKYYYCIKDYFCGGRKQASKGDVVQALRGLPIMGLKDAGEYFLPVNSIKCNSAWSEEDEKMLQGIWDEILANKHNAKECEWKTYDKFLDWLKSLKPQNRWKPSDEQLEALKDAIRIKPFENPSNNLLWELYEQLKKLREE